VTASAPAHAPLQGLLAELTLEEKVRMLEGVSSWRTFGVERLGIPALFLTDGPHGVRKSRDADGAFGVADNVPSTAFPTSATLANSWDPENARRAGAAIGRECVDLGVDVLLAPGINLQRSPLCGRNFEYYSEDPLVSAAFGTAFVRGVQAQGVAASVKHFAANSNEDYRFVGDSLVDERALRELYLRQFERVVREAKPATVMCAYNAVNGTFSSDNRELLTDILRTRWGFDGLVMTDWGATHDRVASLHAGCELDMPGDAPHNREAILAAVREGRLPMETLDEAVRRVLALVDWCRTAEKPTEPHDPAVHAALAGQLAIEGAVLLANDGTLPLSADASELVVVGELFERMRFQGAGSSLITPSALVTPRDAFEARGIRYRYARGYRALAEERDAELARQAIAAVDAGDTVLFFGGLTDLEESEGFDRTTMALPASQVELIEQLLATGARVVLALFAGAPVELPFADRLAAVLHLGLPGMHGGEAAAALLFGEASPSGKLAQSWPRTAAEQSALDYNTGYLARYAESIYVGYRYHDAAGTPLRYAFGHGLTYTRFAYRDLRLTVRDGRVEARVTVDNTGDRDGAEIVQLYVRNNRGEVFKAEKELRAFVKVRVPAGGSADAVLTFDLTDLSYWDVARHDWVLENGAYEVHVAASASDIRLRAPLEVTTGTRSRSPYPARVDADYAAPPASVPESFAALLGRELPSRPRHRRLTMETRLVDARGSLIGAIMYRAVLSRVEKDYRAALRMPDGPERDARVKNTHFLVRMMPFQSLRSMTMSSSGALPGHVAVGIAELAARRPFRGLRRMLRGAPKAAAS
jgi:beta-glucosidase